MAELITPLSEKDEFKMALSGPGLRFKSGLQAVAIGLGLVSIAITFLDRAQMRLANNCMNVAMAGVIAAFLIHPLPRKITIRDGEVLFHRMPNACWRILGLEIPLSTTPVVVRSLAAVRLEWGGQTLTLDDTETGRRFRLASGPVGEALARWFQDHGVDNVLAG